jgi:outer membrane receptor protein involved in Fe transport
MKYFNGGHRALPAAAGLAALALISAAGAPEALAEERDTSRRIEEVIVTAERRESTVSDTAISISAFDSQFLENFNIRNQEDLQNFIPATTIQPYDAAIRGIGRTARTLGGDPGVATYFNGAYSEDFGIASTEGGLHDLARVEVLRGPQGTLYGRNAVGGAINFVSNRPNMDSFEGEVKATVGNYGTRELYYLLSAPIVDDVLAFRFTGSDRRRDGYIKNTAPGQDDVNDYGDENYALALEWNVTDNLEVYVRGNERSYRRRFNGGDGTMPIIVSENNRLERNTTDLVFGKRVIDRSQTTNTGLRNYFQAGAPVTTYRHPVTGALVETQKVRPGIDFASSLSAIAPGSTPDNLIYTFGDASARLTAPNYALGHPADRIHIANRDSLDKSDLKIDTNGQYDEFFDHQAVAMNVVYSGEGWELKYMTGYTDFFYDRDTDEDKTGNNRLGSYDFYVLQENENWQHELQLTFDTDKWSVTSGAFLYESTINQRLDLYDRIDTQGRYQNDANYSLMGGIANFGAVTAAFGGQAAPLLDIYQAQRAYEGGAALSAANGGLTLFAPWYGDKGTALRGARHSGTSTPGTIFAWDNDIFTTASALYTQAQYQFNQEWAFTAGVRYAKDEKKANERLIGMSESIGLTPCLLFNCLAGGLQPNYAAWAFDPANADDATACGGAFGGNWLCLMNAANGAIDASQVVAAGGIPVGGQGTNPGDEPIRFTGVPIAFNIYRPLKNDWDTFTWRANVEWKPNDDTLIYLSATTGWRSGGYNLGFFSTATPEYGEEQILAYELGYKGTLLDGRMQLNTSVFVYQYDDIHTIISQSGGLFGVSTNIVNFPEAETFGWEGDITYLLGDNATVGMNWSYTKAEFSGEFEVIDSVNPELPGSVFTAAERTFTGFDGASLPKIPEWKFTGWGSYTVPLGDNGRVDLFTTIGWTDEYFFSAPFERDLESTPAFVRWDARVSWVSADEQWEVSSFVNNITGELGVRQLQSLGEDWNYQRQVTTNDPRVYGLSVAYRMLK